MEEAFVLSTAASVVFRFKDVLCPDVIPAVSCGTVFNRDVFNFC